jgi:hypothetical protein
MKKVALKVTATVGIIGAGLLGATSANAAGAHSQQQFVALQCSDGSTPTVRVAGADNNNTVWGAGQVVMDGSGHLIPVSIAFTSPYGTETSLKGNGNANGNQTTVTCSASLGEGFSLTVVAVPKP